jgi:hypothetical protein
MKTKLVCYAFRALLWNDLEAKYWTLTFKYKGIRIVEMCVDSSGMEKNSAKFWHVGIFKVGSI